MDQVLQNFCVGERGNLDGDTGLPLCTNSQHPVICTGSPNAENPRWFQDTPIFFGSRRR